MNALKAISVAILCLLLFLSLSVFGLMFLIHSTVLNPDFVASRVDELDVSAMARDIVDEELSKEIPEELEFLKDPIYQIIDEHEPWLKEQLTMAIYSAYDYLLSRTDRLEIIIPLEEIKRDLKESVWEILKENAVEWLPEIVDYYVYPYIEENIEQYAGEIPAEFLPPELIGQSSELLVAYLDIFLDDIVGQVEADMSPEITGLLESVLRPYYDSYYDELAADIPSEIIIDENELPSDVMEQLEYAREYIRYFIIAFYSLIGIMVLLVLAIVLIQRSVRDTSRTLGIDLLIYGALEFAGVYFVRQYVPALITSLVDSMAVELPASVELWLTDLFRALLAPLQWFSLAVLIIGVILIILAIFYKPRTAED